MYEKKTSKTGGVKEETEEAYRTPKVRNVDPFERRRRLAAAKQAKLNEARSSQFAAGPTQYEYWDGAKRVHSKRSERLEREAIARGEIKEKRPE